MLFNSQMSLRLCYERPHFILLIYMGNGKKKKIKKNKWWGVGTLITVPKNTLYRSQFMRNKCANHTS